MSDVIINASPLIFLGKAGHLDLLKALGAQRYRVPGAVRREVAAGQDAASEALAEATWLETAGDVEVPAAVQAWDLGPGESAVIATALTSAPARVVIDDLSGRRCALSKGLFVVGTLGVVVAAHRQGLVADARQVLEELRRHGMWLADSVVDRALRIAER